VGNVQATVDALNRRTTFGYDALNRQITTTDALGAVSSTSYDAAGNVATTTDQLGRTTSYGYDADNRQVTKTDALNEVSTTAYDAVGNAITHTDALNHTSTAVYDADNRVIATVDPLGNRSTNVYDAAGELIASVDPLGHRTTSGYDLRGLLVTVTDPRGNVSSTSYDADGNAIAQTDALNHTTTSVYDADNRVIATVDPLGFRTTHIYDAAGNQTVLVDASNNRTTWAYDALNRQISATDPLNHTATTAYDATGEVSSTTDRDGRRIDYAYDADGRMSTEKWFAVGGSLTQTQTWTYDAAGEMLTAQDPDGTYTMGYDPLGRVSSVQEPFNLVLTFGYDANGNRTSVLDSKGGVTTVTFDADNRQLSEQVAGSGVSPMRFDYAYDAASRVTSLTRYSNLAGTSVVGTTAYQYDADNDQTNIKSTSGTGSVLANYTYTYDAANRLTSKVENGSTTSYSYDADNQLTADGASTFGYDGTGNRTNAGYSTGAGNELSFDGTYTYTYDAEGNVTEKKSTSQTWDYTYDNRDQMTSATLTTGTVVSDRVTYLYDAFGNQIERDAWNGSTTTVTRYGLDGWNPAKPTPVGNEDFDAWAQLDGSNALTERGVFGIGADQIIARQSASGTVAWDLTDHEGSVRQVIDNSGTVLGSVTYTAYGAVASGAVYDTYGYTGQPLDSLTSYYSMGNGRREYNPATGLFNQTDPMWSQTGEPNPYTYTRNSPTDATDPSGDWLFAAPSQVGKVAGILSQAGIPASQVSFYNTQTALNDPQVFGLTGFAISLSSLPQVRALGAAHPGDDWFGGLIGGLLNSSPNSWNVVVGDDGGLDPLKNSLADLTQQDLMRARTQLTDGDKFHDNFSNQPSKDRVIIGAIFDGIHEGINNAPSNVGNAFVAVGEGLLEVPLMAYDLGQTMGALIDPDTHIPHYLSSLGQAANAASALGPDAYHDFVVNTWVHMIPPVAIGDIAIDLWNGNSTSFFHAWGGLIFLSRLSGWGEVPGKAGCSEFAKLPETLEGPAKLPGAPETPVLKPPAPEPVIPTQSVLSQLYEFCFGKSCFAAGTPLLTPAGSKPIEEFVAGDFVLSRDEFDPTGDVVSKLVEEVFRRSAKMLSIRVGNRTIRTTDEHPFWVHGKGWLPARQLIAGDGLVSHDGQRVVVSEVVDTGKWEVVYNLRIADFHTYFVGCEEWGFSVWAHNLDVCVQKIVLSAEDAKWYGLSEGEAYQVLVDGKPVGDPVATIGEANAAADGLRPPTPSEPKPPGKPIEPEPAPSRVPEAFDTFEDATGVIGELTEVEYIGETNNPGIAVQGYTQKWVGKGPDGQWYSASYNPTTNKWSFGKLSSRNDP
jgi:RHS repeat-associated protein